MREWWLRSGSGSDMVTCGRKSQPHPPGIEVEGRVFLWGKGKDASNAHLWGWAAEEGVHGKVGTGTSGSSVGNKGRGGIGEGEDGDDLYRLAGVIGKDGGINAPPLGGGDWTWPIRGGGAPSRTVGFFCLKKKTKIRAATGQAAENWNNPAPAPLSKRRHLPSATPSLQGSNTHITKTRGSMWWWVGDRGACPPEGKRRGDPNPNLQVRVHYVQIP
ncbi:hypothetical protein BGW80DRAFT_1450210 [Lactifluus volemus]|nr:hypothetical protein BGW80DRAFT_1450210 [Lactifluus volemus]